MQYYTIKQIEDTLPDGVIICDITYENRWVVLWLNSNLRVKIRNF